jgi:hypothetical protein
MNKTTYLILMSTLLLTSVAFLYAVIKGIIETDKKKKTN